MIDELSPTAWVLLFPLKTERSARTHRLYNCCVSSIVQSREKLLICGPGTMTSFAHCNHLVIVCCHAIYLGGPTHGASEDEWSVLSFLFFCGRSFGWSYGQKLIFAFSLHRLIEPFQDGETPTFIQHVKSGVAKLAEDPLAILVFSGYVMQCVPCLCDSRLTEFAAEAQQRNRKRISERANHT